MLPVFLIGSPSDAQKWLGEKAFVFYVSEVYRKLEEVGRNNFHRRRPNPSSWG